jgi:hypothetical protein
VATGTAITLTAKANSGSIFVGWDGACQGSAANCTVTLNSATTVSAMFKPIFNLSVSSGKGTVISNPAGINCGVKSGSCSAKFTQGTSLSLTATAPAGATFTGWTGACSGTSLTCTLTMNGDTSVQASFK